MTTKHTRGPWHTNKPIESNGYVWVDPIDGVCGEIATAWPTTTDGEAEANARLIAAAPELLEALIELNSVSARGFLYDDPARIKARAAIAKATGSQS